MPFVLMEISTGCFKTKRTSHKCLTQDLNKARLYTGINHARSSVPLRDRNRYQAVEVKVVITGGTQGL